jgi:hypothetical protein
MVRRGGTGIAQWYSLDYGLDDPEFESLQGLGICLFTTASRQVLGPIQPLSRRYKGLIPWG